MYKKVLLIMVYHWGVYQLSHFLATQNVKHKMLGLIVNTLQNVDSGSFRPFKYRIYYKRSGKGKQQNELDDVYFETMISIS